MAEISLGGDESDFAFPINALHDLNQILNWGIILQIKNLLVLLQKDCICS